jgi:hypothetical protein
MTFVYGLQSFETLRIDIEDQRPSRSANGCSRRVK